MFTLATTLLWGLAELFYKKGSHEEEKFDHLRVCIMVGAVMGIHAVYTLLTSDIRPNEPDCIPAGFTVLHCFNGLFILWYQIYRRITVGPY